MHHSKNSSFSFISINNYKLLFYYVLTQATEKLHKLYTVVEGPNRKKYFEVLGGNNSFMVPLPQKKFSQDECMAVCLTKSLGRKLLDRFPQNSQQTIHINVAIIDRCTQTLAYNNREDLERLKTEHWQRRARPQAEPRLNIHAFLFYLNILNNIGNSYFPSFITKCAIKLLPVTGIVYLIHKPHVYCKVPTSFFIFKLVFKICVQSANVLFSKSCITS